MTYTGEVRPCTKCSAVLVWNATRKVWEGQHLTTCPIARSKQGNEVVNALRPEGGVAPHLPEVGYEDVIGQGKLWSVTASTGRTLGGEWITDTFHVRAPSREAALLLAHEVRPYMHDAEAVQLED